MPTLSHCKMRGRLLSGNGCDKKMVEIGYKLACEEHAPLDLVSHARQAEDAGFAFAVNYPALKGGAWNSG